MIGQDASSSLEARIERLERMLGARDGQNVTAGKEAASSRSLPTPRAAAAAAFLAAGLYLSYLGLGLPNHPYQLMLGVLATALAYHRRWLRLTASPSGWLLALANAAQISALFKLMIGSGVKQPFHWLKYPELSRAPASGGWLNVLPDVQVQWVASPLATWELDLTLTQTFLLIVTLIGALFRFQPFASLTALLLILCSLPAFGSFNWTWVFPAMTIAAVGLYLQGADARG